MYVLKGRFALVGAAVAFAALLVLALSPVAQTQTTQGVNPAPKCFGKTATMVGTDGPDQLVGTFGDQPPTGDVIVGLGGTDNIRGEADFGGMPEGDADALCGNDGDDGLLDGADKSDQVSGGPGADIVDGDNFPSQFGDRLRGDSGDDTVTGGQGNDTSIGGSGNDRIDVGTGSTVPQGADTIRGGPGDDTINGAETPAAKDTINCGRGMDTVTAGPEDQVERKGKGRCEDVTRTS